MMAHFLPLPIDTPAFRVQGLGVQEKMTPRRFDRPRGWPQFLFVLFLDRAACDTGSRCSTAEPGTLICWRPRTPHALGNAELSWNHSWLSVGGSEVERALRETRFPLDRPLVLNDFSFFDSALAEIYNEVNRPAKGPDRLDVRLAQSYVVNLIRRLARAIRLRPPGRAAPESLLELRRYIDSHFVEPLALADLATRAGFSVSQLCLLHQRHFGTTVMAYLRHVRFQRAALLLRDSPLKVRTVAEMVGFPDEHHFSKAFRREFGRPPARFRSVDRGADARS